MFLERLFNFIPKNEFSKALGLFNTGQYRKALKKFEELQEIGESNDEVDGSTLELYTCEAHVVIHLNPKWIRICFGFKLMENSP